MRKLSLLLALAATLLPGQITFDRIVNANKEPQNWLTYSGTPLSQRHSLLTQITPAQREEPRTAVDLPVAIT